MKLLVSSLLVLAGMVSTAHADDQEITLGSGSLSVGGINTYTVDSLGACQGGGNHFTMIKIRTTSHTSYIQDVVVTYEHGGQEVVPFNVTIAPRTESAWQPLSGRGDCVIQAEVEGYSGSTSGENSFYDVVGLAHSFDGGPGRGDDHGGWGGDRGGDQGRGGWGGDHGGDHGGGGGWRPQPPPAPQPRPVPQPPPSRDGGSDRGGDRGGDQGRGGHGGGGLQPAPRPQPGPSAPLPGGSWTQSCRNYSMQGTKLVGECKNVRGNWIQTSWETGGKPVNCANNNGSLTCN